MQNHRAARRPSRAGLLADDGTGLATSFTGDVPRAMLTMSRLGAARGSAAARHTFAWFVTTPTGSPRCGADDAEIMKERWKAARQERLDVLPRIHRGWTYAGLRAATNVLQRDLNTAVIAEEMRKGTQRASTSTTSTTTRSPTSDMFRLESWWPLTAGSGPRNARAARRACGRATDIVVLATTASPRAKRSGIASAPTSARCAPVRRRRKWPHSTPLWRSGDESIPRRRPSPAPA